MTERGALSHRQWLTAAAEEYERLIDLLEGLAPEEWTRSTDCAEWDVRQIVCHLVGAAEAVASPREAARQRRLGRRLLPGRPDLDGMNAVQVSERADATPAELLRLLAVAGDRSIRTRRWLPAPLRAVPVEMGPPPWGTRPLGYLMDRVQTRGVWLHRVDIARATGQAPVLTAEHDGAIVGDVVAEWAGTHGQPFTLVLTGPAGGRWSCGDGGAYVALDAVEFCRVLAGRGGGGDGLLAYRVPF